MTPAKKGPPSELLSIEREAEMCQKAFENVKVGAIVQHCHHAEWLEILSEPAFARIAHILKYKDADERALRLRLFRPLGKAGYLKLPLKLRKAYAEWQKADAEWQKAYAERQKADAEWQKAYAEWQKADAERQKADAEWQKADAEWQKAYETPSALKAHAVVCGCKWGETTDIFGGRR